MPDRPNPLKRILVASDLSDQAGIAIERAIELGVEHGAEVSIVHVIDEDLPPQVQSFLTTTSDHDIRDKIKNLPQAGRVSTTIDIVSGRPELDIVERAEIDARPVWPAGGRGRHSSQSHKGSHGPLGRCDPWLGRST